MDNEVLRTAVAQVIDLSDDDFALLLGCVTCKQLKKGEALLKQGEICQAFYLVEKGYLRTHFDKDGAVINLNFTFEGDYAANLKSFKAKLPSDFTIEAGEDTTVWIFSVRQISGQFGVHPQIAKFVRRLAIRMLLASEAHSELVKIYTPTERYHYIEKNNPQLLQRISLSQLASYLGVTRETLSRIRAKRY